MFEYFDAKSCARVIAGAKGPFRIDFYNNLICTGLIGLPTGFHYNTAADPFGFKKGFPGFCPIFILQVFLTYFQGRQFRVELLEVPVVSV